MFYIFKKRFYLKEFLDFLSENNIVSFLLATKAHNYKYDETLIEITFNSLYLKDSPLMKICIKNIRTDKNGLNYDSNDYYSIITTLILLLKVLCKKGKFDYNFKNLNDCIKSINAFNVFERIDKYLNSKNVVRFNDNYKKVVDVFLKKVEENKDKIPDIPLENCTIDVEIGELFDSSWIDEEEQTKSTKTSIEDFKDSLF